MGIHGQHRHVVTRRTDRGERVIAAPPSAIFDALTDGALVARWRAPEGMRGEVHEFDARPGGRFSMTLHYEDRTEAAGKTSEHADSFEGRFLDIVDDTRIVEEVRFQSADPAFAEPMVVETTLSPADAGTIVRMEFRNVPEIIKPEDHAQGIASALENLARLVE